jgi:hypothetical protein
MKPIDDHNCLTERHLLLFGTIVHWFARYELLMQQIMAVVLQVESGCILLLTRDLDFSEKRQALFDLLRHRKIPLDQTISTRSARLYVILSSSRSIRPAPRSGCTLGGRRSMTRSTGISWSRTP